jgi:preprotein translocase SecE subunit
MVENTDTLKWYVVHCHSGFEKKVADSILDEAKKVNLEDSISEVSVPTQAVVEVRRGVRVNSEKKFFPGYVLIKMVMNDDTWHLVRDIPKVSNFLGTKDKPIPISEREVSKVTWPSKRETFTSAGIVLVVISIAAIILMLLDQFFSFIVRIVLG